MALVVITLKIMPENPDVNLGKLEGGILEEIKKFSERDDIRVSEEAIGFGLNAVKVVFVMDEEKGGTERLEKAISGIEGVNSVEVLDVRRAVG